MDINTYQTIFSLFYTLYSAMAITVTGKTQPFDTPSMFKGHTKSWLRFFLSLLLLNGLPLMTFVFVFNALSENSASSLTIYSALLLFMPSLVALGFYRIHFGLMIWKTKQGYVFYDKYIYKKKESYLPISLYTDLNARPEHHKEPLAHIIPGIVLPFPKGF